MLSTSKRINTSLAISAVLLTTILGQTILTSQTHATGDSSSTNASVVMNPVITVSLSSSDLIISNLAPNTISDSNTIDVSVSTNAIYGYYLSATAGDGDTSSSNHNNSLNNTVDSNYKFTSLSNNKATLTNFDDGTWGYSYSKDNGSTWISGSQGTTSNGYNGLPVDNDDNGTTGIALISTDSPTNNNSVKFKIGAKSSSTQAAGTYTNTINFYAVTNPEPPETMQDFAAGTASTTCANMSAGDTLTLRDSRDQTEYLVGKLADGNCWMLDNLALDLVVRIDNLNEDNTNASNVALSYLKNGGGSTTEGNPTYKYASAGIANWTSGITNSFSAPLANLAYKNVIPADTTSTAGGYRVGGYYNYCAASAGSYCYGDGASEGTSTGNATEDICPKGWRMPTGSSGGEYKALYNNTNYNTYNSYRLALHLPLSGYYSDGKFYSGSNGSFWSSVRFVNTGMNILEVNHNDIRCSSNSYRSYGFSVRCIMDS